MFGGNIPSIPLTAPITGGYNTNDGWGNNGAWWIIIILFAIFGWGRGGYGYGNGYGQGYGSYLSDDDDDDDEKK